MPQSMGSQARTTAQLDDGWGQPRRWPRSLDDVRRLDDVDPSPGPASRRIDDRTRADLDLPLVFCHVDRTVSPPGAQRLWQVLANPTRSADELAGRERLIARLGDDPDARRAVLRRLEPVAKVDVWTLPSMLWGDIAPSPVPPAVLRAMGLALPVTIALAFWLPVLWLVAMALFGVNTMTNLWLERTVGVHLATLGQLHRVLCTARGLVAEADHVDDLAGVAARLERNLTGTRAISNRTAALRIRDPFDLINVVRAGFLRDAITFFSLRDLAIAHRDQLQAIYKDVGWVDAAQAIASFRADQVHWCRPELVDGDGRDQGVAIEDLRHPAVRDAIGNDLELAAGTSLLVTGSNMSGKTTFLKAVAVAAVTAQSIHTVCARRYRAPRLGVMSSVDTLDDLGGGKSYYLDEVESVLRLVRAADEGAGPWLFVADEMFRGTNPIERIAAAAEVLLHLAAGGIVVAATHDLELCRLVAARFDSGHFEERVSEDGVAFDYRLRPGPCTTRNAIALLKVMGYPAAIVDGATARVARHDGAALGELAGAEAEIN